METTVRGFSLKIKFSEVQYIFPQTSISADTALLQTVTFSKNGLYY